MTGESDKLTQNAASTTTQQSPEGQHKSDVRCKKITFLTVYQTLSHLAGITVKLQSATLDIIKEYQMVEEIKAVYRRMRENIAVEFSKIYEQAVMMTAAVDVEPSKPRGVISVSRINQSIAFAV